MYLKIQDNRTDKIKNKLQPKLLLPKLVTMLINLFKIGPRISFQLLKANIWVRLISTLAMLIVDVVRHIKGHTSKKQFIIDIVLSLSLLIGGTVGWYAGTGIILAENTVLWIFAGIIGSGGLGALTEKLAKKILSKYISSDLDEMLAIFNQEFTKLVEEHNLTELQAQQIAQNIRLNTEKCIECLKQENKEQYAKECLESFF